MKKLLFIVLISSVFFLDLIPGGNTISLGYSNPYLPGIANNAALSSNFLGNQIYGEMWFHNDSSPNVTSLPAKNAWYNITAFGGQHKNGQKLNGFTYSNTSSSLTTSFAGLYDAKFCITFSGVVNENYHLAIAINDVIQLQTEVHNRISSGTDVADVCGVGYLQLALRDRITVQAMDSTGAGSATMTIYSGNLNLVRIGE